MLDPRRVLDEMVARIDRERLNAYAVHVLVGNGSEEHRWVPDRAANVYSVSKGIGVLAAGIAVGEGLFSGDSCVVDVLGVRDIGAGAEAVTLRHLLTMRSGIDFEWFAGQPIPGDDLAQAMLRLPSNGPGRFQYSDASTYLAMRMLAARVGDVSEWLQPRLFSPLGIPEPTWQRCPLGFVVGGSGLELRTSELARIGRLLRDGGRVGRKQLVDRAWVAAMHRSWVETGAPAPWGRYGWATWDGPGAGWRLDGLYGQYVFVAAAQDAVVTITAHEEARDHRLVEIAAEVFG